MDPETNPEESLLGFLMVVTFAILFLLLLALWEVGELCWDKWKSRNNQR